MPLGVHDCELSDVETMFVFNPDRELVWGGFKRFLIEITPITEINVLYIDGGFVTNNDRPKDVDIVLEFADVQMLFGVLSRNPSLLDRDGIKATYKVDLWFAATGQPSNIPDLRLFFQYLRPEDALSRNLPAGSKKGVLRTYLRT